MYRTVPRFSGLYWVLYRLNGPEMAIPYVLKLCEPLNELVNIRYILVWHL